VWAGRAEIQPLGDSALLVRFGTSLDDAANRRAIGLAARLTNDAIEGVVEVVPSLVSVLVRYDPVTAVPERIAGEIRLRLDEVSAGTRSDIHTIGVRFSGPDIAEVAQALGVSVGAFIARHNGAPLRVLATGFAPGFVYCGFHAEDLVLPRRQTVRPVVPAGAVLFAAGQTAIAATDIPTGWHWIGSTEFRNFDPSREPPTRLIAGDVLQFEAAS
jgi:KipI family sensor histidine kinase inhibitor